MSFAVTSTDPPIIIDTFRMDADVTGQTRNGAVFRRDQEEEANGDPGQWVGYEEFVAGRAAATPPQQSARRLSFEGRTEGAVNMAEMAGDNGNASANTAGATPEQPTGPRLEGAGAMDGNNAPTPTSRGASQPGEQTPEATRTMPGMTAGGAVGASSGGSSSHTAFTSQTPVGGTAGATPVRAPSSQAGAWPGAGTGTPGVQGLPAGAAATPGSVQMYGAGTLTANGVQGNGGRTMGGATPGVAMSSQYVTVQPPQTAPPGYPSTVGVHAPAGGGSWAIGGGGSHPVQGGGQTGTLGGGGTTMAPGQMPAGWGYVAPGGNTGAQWPQMGGQGQQTAGVGLGSMPAGTSTYGMVGASLNPAATPWGQAGTNQGGGGSQPTLLPDLDQNGAVVAWSYSHNTNPGWGVAGSAAMGPQAGAVGSIGTTLTGPTPRWAGAGENSTGERRSEHPTPVSRGRLGTYNDWQHLGGIERGRTVVRGARLNLPGLQERLDRVWGPRLYNDGHLNKGELKVARPFSGDTRDGSPTLKSFWHDVWMQLLVWESAGWDLRQFFLRMGPLMSGAAKEVYMEIRVPLMGLHEMGSNGQPLRDDEGRPVLLQDPVARFFAELERRFPVQGVDREREFANFRRREGEGPDVCAARLWELASVVGIPDGPGLVGHFLSVYPEETRKGAAMKLGLTLGHDVTLEDAVLVVTALLGPVAALQRSIYRAHFGHRGREDKPRHGGDAGVSAFRADHAPPRSSTDRRLCYNCGKPGHLIKDCPEPPREGWADRSGETEDAGLQGGPERGENTTELQAQYRRLQAELRRRRALPSSRAQVAEVETEGEEGPSLGEEHEEDPPTDWVESDWDVTEEVAEQRAEVHVAWEL